MLDSEKEAYGRIIWQAFKEHGPSLYRRQVEQLTELNELQVKAGIIYLLNQQILDDVGYKVIHDPCSTFILTNIGTYIYNEIKKETDTT